MTRVHSSVLVILYLVASSCGAAETPADRDDAVRILPLGDSITEGFSVESTYRSWLWIELQREGHSVDFVGSLHGPRQDEDDLDFDPDHEGHWGWRTDEVRDQVADWAETTRPDIVLLHLGHNDLWLGQSIASTVNEIAEIVAIVRRSSPKATFLLAKIIPAGAPGLEAIPEFNREIAVLAPRLSTSESPVLTVDLATGFDPSQNTVDGVHPNESGARKMARAWQTVLEEVLEADKFQGKRLHLRYDAEHFPEDLVFQQTDDRSNFQGRYVLRHPWEGEAQCEAAERYFDELPEQFDGQAQQLASLTGWDISDIRERMTIPEPASTEPWWKRIWD